MSVLILDLETTTKTHLGRKASPFTDNWIVADGWGTLDGNIWGAYHEQDEKITIPDLTDVSLLVGHNIKFDLLYLWEYPEIQAYLKAGGKIWDTQLAEYLIMGHVSESHMNSLNDCALKYGGNHKIDAVKEMWQAGIDTPDIPKDLLMDYLLGTDDMEGDIGNTTRVFTGQLAKAKAYPKEFLTQAQQRMESLLATIEMEYNGLHIDMESALVLREELKKTVQQLDIELEQYIPELPPECVFKWTSNYDKSYLIFGGVKKYGKWVQHTDEHGNLLFCKTTEKWPLYLNEPRNPDDCFFRDETGLYEFNGVPQDVFKSGKQKGAGKFRNVEVADLERKKGAIQDHFFTFPGYTTPNPRWESACTDGDDKPIFSTSAEVIESLGNKDIPFLKALASRAKFNKDLGTYYYDEDENGNRKGMLTRVGDDSIIHHSLNHTSTVTSRMSSSNPNLQNIPRKGTSKAKQMFTSRFGKDGSIVEMDYSALEVYVQAVLMQIATMQNQIAEGIDFHCLRLSMALEEDYDAVYIRCKDESHPDHKKYDGLRTDIKGFSFQLAYGAGASAIAEAIGQPVEVVKGWIANEHSAYPELLVFDQILEETIERTWDYTGKQLYVGGVANDIGRGHWFSPTGTRYTWEQHETPDFVQERGKFVGFSPTERKNYPTQGEGGLVMQTMLGCLYRYFLAKDNWGGKALLVNTVHDSVYLDIHNSLIHEVVPTAVTILAAVKQKYTQLYPNFNVPIDFKVDAEVGPSMYAVKGYNKETDYELK